MSPIARRLAGLGVAVAAGIMVAGSAVVPAQADPVEANDDMGTFVIGGEPAEEGQYPWMVRLSMGCGGSLLTEQVVLTADHCVGGTGDDTSIGVEHGSVDLDSPDITEYQSEYVQASGTEGDWALIKLSEPVADAEVLPIAEDDANDQGDFEVMGWGATSEGGPQQTEMQWATVPHIDGETCDEAYSDVGGIDVDGEICAGLLDTGGVDACQGDSGGPLVSYADGEPVNVGIVSWGVGCARPGQPGVYAKVSHWADDINDGLQQLP